MHNSRKISYIKTIIVHLVDYICILNDVFGNIA
jgi:hypothetical protein